METNKLPIYLNGSYWHIISLLSYFYNNLPDVCNKYSVINYRFLYYREEMEDVVGSVFDLMGRTSDPLLEEEVISERVDTIFEVCM